MKSKIWDTQDVSVNPQQHFSFVGKNGLGGFKRRVRVISTTYKQSLSARSQGNNVVTESPKKSGFPDFESRQGIRGASWNVFLNRNPYFRIEPSPSTYPASKSVGK